MSDPAAPSSRLDRLVDVARREPARCLAAVLALHVVVWTALPALLSYNLQLDLAEGLALGREWQLGYWKLPPLPWWLDYGLTSCGALTLVACLGCPPDASAPSLAILVRLAAAFCAGPET